MYPALVIRQALSGNVDNVLWVGGEGGMEAGLVQRAGISYQAIPAGQIAGMGLRTLPNLARVFKGTLASRRILNDFKPDVLLFTGGYVAVPMALAGSGFAGVHRVPSLVFVPDIEPGLALKLVARFASIIGVTTEESRQYFPSEKRCVVTGYPTRPELLDWSREKAQAHLGLQPGQFTLLVTGGSTGARSINRALLAILPELLKEMQVVHLSGSRDWPEVEAAQGQLPAGLAENYHPYAYLHEMGAALAAADLVVSRAGASVLGEYPLFGLPAILVPYPHAWRYQKVNAGHLVQREAALMIEDARLSEELLPAVLRLSRDQQQLQHMRQAMRAEARPQAAQQLAALAEELAQEPTGKRGSARLEHSGNRERQHG